MYQIIDYPSFPANLLRPLQSDSHHTGKNSMDFIDQISGLSIENDEVRKKLNCFTIYKFIY